MQARAAAEGQPQFRPNVVVGGHYRIAEHLASGSMGEVYLVEHLEQGRALAMKVMLPWLTQDRRSVQRFRLEAEAVTRIGHPNIVGVSDFGSTDDGRLFMVMEYLEGVTLSQLLEKSGPQPVARVLAIGVQLAQALTAAHEREVIHRDLKPDNVMLVRRHDRDFVKILDFGVARIETGQMGVTIAGSVIGTPRYMSPEQCRGQPIDGRTDVYALGLVLQELLTGAPVFNGKSRATVMLQQVNEAPAPPPSFVPREFATLLERMLAKDPAERPQRMAEVLERLVELSRVAPPYIPPRANSAEALPLVFASAADSEAVRRTLPRSPPELDVLEPTLVRDPNAETVVRAALPKLWSDSNLETVVHAPMPSLMPTPVRTLSESFIRTALRETKPRAGEMSGTSPSNPSPRRTSAEGGVEQETRESESGPHTRRGEAGKAVHDTGPVSVNQTLIEAIDTPTFDTALRRHPLSEVTTSTARGLGRGLLWALALLVVGVVVAAIQLRERFQPPVPIESVSVRVESVPPGALVLERGALVGTTPFTLSRPVGSTVELQFVLEGTQGAWRTLAMRKAISTVEVTLPAR